MSDNTGSPQPRPPLLIRLTGYRLLTVVMITALGTAKAVVSYQGKTIISNSLDWVMGVVLAIALYLLGLYESVNPPVLPWLFHYDYSPGMVRGFRLCLLYRFTVMVVLLDLIGNAMFAWLAYDSLTKPDRNGRDIFSGLGFGCMVVMGLAGLLHMIRFELLDDDR